MRIWSQHWPSSTNGTSARDTEAIETHTRMVLGQTRHMMGPPGSGSAAARQRSAVWEHMQLHRRQRTLLNKAASERSKLQSVPVDESAGRALLRASSETGDPPRFMAIETTQTAFSGWDSTVGNSGKFVGLPWPVIACVGGPTN